MTAAGVYATATHDPGCGSPLTGHAPLYGVWIRTQIGMSGYLFGSVSIEPPHIEDAPAARRFGCDLDEAPPRVPGIGGQIGRALGDDGPRELREHGAARARSRTQNLIND